MVFLRCPPPVVASNIRQAFGVQYLSVECTLEKRQEIPTAIDPLRWDYYQYILSHPIVRWDASTAILYGGKDSLQPLHSIQSFSNRFGAELTVSPESEHSFLSESDLIITARWLRKNIR